MLELHEFLEKFAPDYKRRKSMCISTKVSLDLDHVISIFNEVNFPYALQRFINKLCEKQRENCADSFGDYDSVLNAKQPKISEL
jgi:hypothetical protein